MSQGDEDSALGHAQTAYSLRPDDAEALSLLGLCLVGREESREDGYEKLRRAIKLEPREPRWHLHLAQGLTKTQRLSEAEKSYAAAAELSGGHAGLLMQWGQSLMRAGRPADASQVYARVIQKNPKNTGAWLAAYDALIAAGDTINAVFAFEKAYPEPRSDEAIAKLADMNIALGHYDKAQVFNEQLRVKSPHDPDAGLRAANLMRWNGNIAGAKALQAELWARHNQHPGLAAASLQDGDGAAYDAAQKIALSSSTDTPARRSCAFALCAYMDKTGETDAAWEWATLANSLYSDADTGLDSLRTMLDKAVMAYHLIPDAELSEDRATNLIYIVGPPRSGGSLLQTILARHPGARSVGERGALLGFIPQMLDDPESLAAQLEPLAKSDIAGMTRAVGMADFFIDKTPHYFLIAGLLEKVHAGATFVAPHRDEADMAVSLYFHEFGEEFPFTRSMESIKEYLDFHEAALVRWREAGVKVIAHNHDRFVEDTKARGAALCEGLGLTWSDDMLEESEADGAVRTFSARQVRGGVSSKYKGRGERYASHLKAAGFNL